MRLGVLLPFFVIALATASPPAVAQTAPSPKEEKKAEGAKDKKAPKAEKKDKKAPKPEKEKAPKPEKEKAPKPEKKADKDNEGGPSVGEPGSGGKDPAGSQRAADGSGSAGERGENSAAATGCTDECDPLGGLSADGEGNIILAASGSGRSSRDAASREAGGGAEASIEFEERGSASAAGGPAALGLLALSALGLLVGLFGGLSAFQDRQRGG